MEFPANNFEILEGFTFVGVRSGLVRLRGGGIECLDNFGGGGSRTFLVRGEFLAGGAGGSRTLAVGGEIFWRFC